MTAPSNGQLSTITPELSARLLEPLLPLLTNFEKSADDEPIRIETSNLVLPLDGDLTRLSGRMRIDFGTMQFATADWFGRLLESTNNRAAGSIGGRIDPVDVTFDRGIRLHMRLMPPTSRRANCAIIALC